MLLGEILPFPHCIFFWTECPPHFFFIENAICMSYLFISIFYCKNSAIYRSSYVLLFFHNAIFYSFTCISMKYLTSVSFLQPIECITLITIIIYFLSLITHRKNRLILESKQYFLPFHFISSCFSLCIIIIIFKYTWLSMMVNQKLLEIWSLQISKESKFIFVGKRRVLFKPSTFQIFIHKAIEETMSAQVSLISSFLIDILLK